MLVPRKIGIVEESTDKGIVTVGTGETQGGFKGFTSGNCERQYG